MECCSRDSISQLPFSKRLEPFLYLIVCPLHHVLLHCICNLYMHLLGGVQQKEEKGASFKWVIFRSILSSESNMGRNASLLVRLHYDLVTLKIGSEGGLPANWKTNQYNSISGLVPPNHITSLPSCSPPLSAQIPQPSPPPGVTYS